MKYGRRINIAAVKKENERIRKLHQDYKKRFKKSGAEGEALNLRQFRSFYNTGKLKGETSRDFVDRLVSHEKGDYSRREIVNLKNEFLKREAEQEDADEELMELVENTSTLKLRNDKALQKQIYEKLKSRIEKEDLSQWWTENIIGSD